MTAERPAVIVRPRVYIGTAIALGPGKIDLLRLVAETRSIAAAARRLGIPYKRAWLLLDSLNQGFGHPVIDTASGGKGGGGTSLTPLGEQLLHDGFSFLAHHYCSLLANRMRSLAKARRIKLSVASGLLPRAWAISWVE